METIDKTKEQPLPQIYKCNVCDHMSRWTDSWMWMPVKIPLETSGDMPEVRFNTCSEACRKKCEDGKLIEKFRNEYPYTQIIKKAEMNTSLTYGQALEAAKQGKRISRVGWNGKSMFVFQRPGDTLPESVIANVKSLPDSVKAFLITLNKPVEFLPYLCMWSAQEQVVNGWLASQTDMLANDWCILD